MKESPAVPDYLRAWLLTEEDYEAAGGGFLDGKAAWFHFAPLWTSLGYSICHGTVDETKPRRSIANLDAAKDPFHPTTTGPFVYSVPDKFDSYYARNPRAWQMRNPRVTFAYDNFNRLVIIKALESSKASSELEIISYLNSPALCSSPKNHTIPVLQQVESEGWYLLIMPAWNMSCAPPHLVWQVDDYFEMVIQTLEGLSFMHEHGVAHRDISMSNIVFNQDGTQPTLSWGVYPVISTWNVRLAFIDFGISKRFSLEADPNTWLAADSWGTPCHMAPEVVRAEEKPADYRVLPADVYALASIWKRWIDWEKERVDVIGTQPDLRTVEVATYAFQVLEKYVPQFMQLIGEMLDADPVRRPTAAATLSKFEAMRVNIPEQLRFAPPGGYPEGLV